MKSFYVKYWMEDGGWMLGGVKKSESCRYQRREDAQSRIDGIAELYPDRKVEYEIVESQLTPEIFHHCVDSSATCVGCRCGGCKKILTSQDAADAGQRDGD